MRPRGPVNHFPDDEYTSNTLNTVNSTMTKISNYFLDNLVFNVILFIEADKRQWAKQTKGGRDEESREDHNGAGSGAGVSR